jgi:hypothetical protein
MMTKSATALRWVVHQYFSAISVIVEIGMANFGSGGGSSSLHFFNRQEMGRSRACCASKARCGLGYPSRTNFWETNRSALATV